MACSKVSDVSDVVKKFQDVFSFDLKLKFSNDRPTLGEPGVGNLIFYVSYMCMDRPNFITFLQETGLVKSEMFRIKCSGEMRLAKKTSVSDGFKWVCRKKACASEASFRFDSWFSCSKLNLEEIFLLTFFVVKGMRTNFIHDNFFFSSSTLADWRQFVNEVICDHVELTFEKIGGPGNEDFIVFSM